MFLMDGPALPKVLVFEPKNPSSDFTTRLLNLYGLEEDRVDSEAELYEVLNDPSDLLLIQGLSSAETFRILKNIEQLQMKRFRMSQVLSVIVVSPDAGRFQFPLLVGVDVIGVIKNKLVLKEALQVFRARLRKQATTSLFARGL
jgi:hypothetical protein